MGKIKGFFKKDIDGGLIVAVLICFPVGVYKLFFQTENRNWSILTGIVFILASTWIIYRLIKNKGKI
jgi:Kef-type K+ transport system membrane component KefB